MDKMPRKAGYEPTVRLIVEGVDVVPGSMPDGTEIAMFQIETANTGTLEWMLSPRQAVTVAALLTGYARSASGYTRRR